MKQKGIWFALTVCAMIATVTARNEGSAQEHHRPILYTHAHGLSIAYQRSGSGPALLLLHGFTQDSRVWKRQIDSLSGQFTVLAWDAPGAGLSADPPDSFSMNDWADCLAALLDSNRIQRAHVLGISWGGVLAEEFYRRHPRYVISLILAGTNAGWRGSFGDSIAKVRLAACLEDASLPPRELIIKYLPGMFGDSPPLILQDELAEFMHDVHPHGFRLMAEAIASADMRMVLSNVTVPVLLVWGESDKRSPVSVARDLHEKIPGAKLEILPKTGHMCNMESPARFNTIVRDYCLQHSGK